MEDPRARLVLVPGGKPQTAPSRPIARGLLRVVPPGQPPEVEQALADAVEAARQIRLEIERRIARALEAFEDSR